MFVSNPWPPAQPGPMGESKFKASSFSASPVCIDHTFYPALGPSSVIFKLPNGACAHYVMVSKFQWKPFWLATQRDLQNDWTATQYRVNYDVFAQAPSSDDLQRHSAF